MSRIGKQPVSLPAGVEVKISGNNVVTVKGPKGELQEQISNRLKIEIKDGVLTVAPDGDDKEAREAHGLYRSLINNMVTGVTAGFEKKLQLGGVGYRAEKNGKKLVLHLGFSHTIEMEDPEGIQTEVAGNEVIVRGIDKALVGNYAAIIRAQKPVEPYKGKGFRYVDEAVLRKEGKAGVKKK
ncbi:MAG TPA: 50S ribosomal protein L6 [Bacillota bacterium]|jgi:large subunit ribosomal protein L6|nr:50S ribosomal protein L6 [Bacillota bacterium]